MLYSKADLDDDVVSLGKEAIANAIASDSKASGQDRELLEQLSQLVVLLSRAISTEQADSAQLQEEPPPKQESSMF